MVDSPARPTAPDTDAAPRTSPEPRPWFFSRWPLHAKARAIRALSLVAYSLHHAADGTAAPPDQYIYLDATLGEAPAKDAIGVAIYRPKDPKGSGGSGFRTGAMINFHGGGFTIGAASDDTRWCQTVCDELGLVVFSVEYRMAPEQPFPVPVEDCANAISAIISRAEEFGIDAHNIALSGFSAGANLALAAWILCHSPDSPHWSYPSLRVDPRSIKGLVLYYPVLNFSIPRATKIADLPPNTPVLPSFLTQLFDQSYIYPTRTLAQRQEVRLSPGLMDEAMLAECPPVHLVICQHDMLAEEARVFARRLQAKDQRRVAVREVEGEPHGWDKSPIGAPKPSVIEEYMEGVRSIRGWI